MPRYDVRCKACGDAEERSKTFDQQKAGDRVEAQPCKCGGSVEIVITQVNLDSDATPTRGYGRSAHAPKLVGKDGKPINVGHTGVTADMIGLTHEQCQRLGI